MLRNGDFRVQTEEAENSLMLLLTVRVINTLHR